MPKYKVTVEHTIRMTRNFMLSAGDADEAELIALRAAERDSDGWIAELELNGAAEEENEILSCNEVKNAQEIS